MQVIERQLVAKTGAIGDCEDDIVVGEHFAAVIDGSTSKVRRLWEGKTSGKMAALLLADAVRCLAADSTRDQAVRALTFAIEEYYRRHDVYDELWADPKQRLAATLVLYSRYQREVWIVGDGQCMLDGKIFANPMIIDQITSNARALFLESELARGQSVAALRARDQGRDLIVPLLERQALFENVLPVTPYGYGVINGFEVPAAYITTICVDEGATDLVLASDGYPFLHPTLEASEQALKQILVDDPLCIRLFKSTKGVAPGNLSFDDRAFLRLRVQANA
jgi:glycerophosphoryl diester phosphodiesterase